MLSQQFRDSATANHLRDFNLSCGDGTYESTQIFLGKEREAFSFASASDADVYWQTVCDAGAYLRLKLFDHFNKEASGKIDPDKLEFPKVSVTLGSGLGAFGDELYDAMVLPYHQIPGLEFLEEESKDSGLGHKKCVIAGRLSDGTPVVALSGRIHPYERGNNVNESAFLTAAVLDAGIEKIILTNAAGSLDRQHMPGTVMLGTSICKETVPNFGTGLAHPYAGDYFFPAHVVTQQYHDRLEEVAKTLGVPTFQGSYVQYPGRRYEFAAEIARLANERQQMLKSANPELAIGAVGMSTGHEVEAVCQHATRVEYKDNDTEIKKGRPIPQVVLLTTITNLGAGLSDTPPHHEEVKEVATKLAPKFIQLLNELVHWMSEENIADQ